MLIFKPTATPTATRFRMSGPLRSAAGVFSHRAADAPLTGIALPIYAGVTGADRLQASLVAAAPNNVPGVRAWSPPV